MFAVFLVSKVKKPYFLFLFSCINLKGWPVFTVLVSGSPYYDNVRPLSYPDSDAVLICFDISRPETLDSVLKKVGFCSPVAPLFCFFPIERSFKHRFGWCLRGRLQDSYQNFQDGNTVWKVLAKAETTLWCLLWHLEMSCDQSSWQEEVFAPPPMVDPAWPLTPLGASGKDSKGFFQESDGFSIQTDWCCADVSLWSRFAASTENWEGRGGTELFAAQTRYGIILVCTQWSDGGVWKPASSACKAAMRSLVWRLSLIECGELQISAAGVWPHRLSSSRAAKLDPSRRSISSGLDPTRKCHWLQSVYCCPGGNWGDYLPPPGVQKRKGRL